MAEEQTVYFIKVQYTRDNDGRPVYAGAASNDPNITDEIMTGLLRLQLTIDEFNQMTINEVERVALARAKMPKTPRPAPPPAAPAAPSDDLSLPEDGKG